MDKTNPPSHVVATAKSLVNRDIQAVKVLYREGFINELNSGDFFLDIAVDIESYDVECLTLPSPPMASSSTRTLPPQEKNKDESYTY